MITVKTIFCSHQAACCSNHDRSMFILSMIETTSRGSFEHAQNKPFNKLLDISEVQQVPEVLDKIKPLNE